ncbi:MAG: hypothetical protein QXO15_08730 [Nitrososphaerota archaeon]
MVLKATTKISGDSKGRKLRIYIPSMLALDSAFPFKKGDKVVIEIDNEKQSLIIRWIGKNDK